QAFQHFARLRLAARIPLDREVVRRLLEARDVAELYELWCFFTMVRGVEEVLGPPAHADAFTWRTPDLVIRHGFRVSWPDGTSLVYNRSFTPSDRRSYSVTLRPDVTLEAPGAGLHLFDAKFRLESPALLMDDNEDDDRRRSFKRDDLYKMHTYRDAIPGARSVWVLYPGTETRFFGTGHTRWDGTGRPPEPLEGVGAVSLKPGRDPLESLRPVLSSLLSRR
ncbi:MAG TPA: nuclease domain-containing protein, partial [Vicinamibacteria bacterium]